MSYNLELDPYVKAISACVFQTKAFPDHLDLFLLFPQSTWNVLLPSAIVPKMGYLLFMEDSWKLCTIFLKGVGEVRLDSFLKVLQHGTLEEEQFT